MYFKREVSSVPSALNPRLPVPEVVQRIVTRGRENATFLRAIQGCLGVPALCFSLRAAGPLTSPPAAEPLPLLNLYTNKFLHVFVL